MKHLQHFLTDEEKESFVDNINCVSFVDEDKTIYLKKYDYSKDYFTINVLTNGTFVFNANVELDEGNSNSVSYSINESEWSEYTNNLELNVNQFDSIRLKGKMQTDYSDNVAYVKQLGIGYFSGGTASFEIKGNIMSLFLEDDFENEEETIYIVNTSRFTYYNAFSGANLISAENLILPNKTSFCMYMSAFYECRKLVIPPQLPSSILSDMCYSYMFFGCTSLEKTPILKANKIESDSYSNMFDGCTNLKHITMLATQGVTRGLENWVRNVSDKGVFVKNKNATWDIEGNSGIPSGWLVQKK